MGNHPETYITSAVPGDILKERTATSGTQYIRVDEITPFKVTCTYFARVILPSGAEVYDPESIGVLNCISIPNSEKHPESSVVVFSPRPIINLGNINSERFKDITGVWSTFNQTN